MTPYYQDDSVTIYHGDCREMSIDHDLVVTDPPYGISLDTDYSKLSGSTRTYDKVHGDDAPFDPSPWLDRPCLMFGANHFAPLLPMGGTWHVWDKRVTAKSNMFADFEMWWTSWRSGPSRIFRYQLIAGVHPGARTERIKHPTVKPVPVMQAAMLSAPDGIILDPFMGSGSTLLAAVAMGRKAIGVELSEAYCEIAAKRLQSAQRPLDFGGAA